MITVVSIILYGVSVLAASGTGASPDLAQRRFGGYFTAACFLLAAILQVAA